MGLYGNKFLNNDLDVNLMKESYDNFYKLFSNDWREKALEEYKLRMEQSLKDKTEKEKQNLLEIERKEREELARLKAKYEK